MSIVSIGRAGKRQFVRVARTAAPDRPGERAGRRPEGTPHSQYFTTSRVPGKLPVRAAFYAGHRTSNRKRIRYGR